MRSSAIRLDSFSTGIGIDKSSTSASDMEMAFQRGHEQGLSEGREKSLDALTVALTGMRDDMAKHDAMAAAMRRTALSELLPVLAAIVDLLGASSGRARLRDALMKELQRMQEMATPQRLLIRCAQDLRPDVDDCLTKAGFSGALIEETREGTLAVDLIADKATISFDPDASVAALQSIINDIIAED